MDKQMTDSELYHEILNVDNLTEELYEQVLDRCNIEHGCKPDCKPRNVEERSEGLEHGVGEGIGFQRLRRITGYLVGDVSRWNDGKRSELEDRIKHGTI